MSGECSIATPGLCGCCAGISKETPQAITNRPALSAIAYCVDTYAQFKASLLSPDLANTPVLRSVSIAYR